MVDEGALHVDVAEQDAVEGIVQHNVEAFESAHDGDFGHAETRAVVAEADITAYLFSHLVEGLAHDAEVLLGGEGAAEPFSGGAIRHIVEERLARGTNHCNNVGSLTGTSLGLYHIFINITRGHDDVEIGFRTLSYRLDIFFTAQTVTAYFLNSSVDNWF